MSATYSTISTAVEHDAVADVPQERTVRVFGPASLSNLGPGFDTLGLCLEGIGDIVEAWRDNRASDRLTLQLASGAADTISLEIGRNTAGVAALEVMNQAGMKDGVVLRIHKGFTPGSGIGSSAASAVAAAWAVNALARNPLDKSDLVEAVLAGEAVASGARHGDNVLPALFGGLVLVSSQNPMVYRQLPLEDDLWVSLVLPEIEVLTRHARALLPKTVPIRSAVNQASALAFMIDAFRSGDWQEVGHWMMKDQIAEPVRAELVPCYRHIKSAALEAGAFGCALTGSGPAMFAITDSSGNARTVLDAMVEASIQAGIHAAGHISRVNPLGASVVNSSSSAE